MKSCSKVPPTETRRIVMDVCVPAGVPIGEMPKDVLLNGKLISAVPVMDEVTTAPVAVIPTKDVPVCKEDCCEECDRVYGFEASGMVQSEYQDFEAHLSENMVENHIGLNAMLFSDGDDNGDIMYAADAARMRNLYMYNELTHQFKSMLANLLEHNVQVTQQMVYNARKDDRKLLYTLIDASKG